MKTKKIYLALTLLLVATTVNAEDIMVEGATRAANIYINLDRGTVNVSDTIDSNLDPEEAIEYFSPGHLALYTVQQRDTTLMMRNGSKAYYQQKGRTLDIYLWPGCVLVGDELICREPATLLSDAEAALRMTIAKNAIKCKVETIDGVSLRDARVAALSDYSLDEGSENAAIVAHAPEWKSFFQDVNELIKANYDLLISQNGNTLSLDELKAVLTRYTTLTTPLVKAIQQTPDLNTLKRAVLFSELSGIEPQISILTGKINHDDNLYTVTVKQYLEKLPDWDSLAEEQEAFLYSIDADSISPEVLASIHIDSITTCKAVLLEITSPALKQPIVLLDKEAETGSDIKNHIYQWRIVDGDLEQQEGEQTDSTNTSRQRLYIFNKDKQNLFLKSETIHVYEKGKRKADATMEYYTMSALDGDDELIRKEE